VRYSAGAEARQKLISVRLAWEGKR
jgi:hypothetical protein